MEEKILKQNNRGVRWKTPLRNKLTHSYVIKVTTKVSKLDRHLKKNQYMQAILRQICLHFHKARFFWKILILMQKMKIYKKTDKLGYSKHHGTIHINLFVIAVTSL